MNFRRIQFREDSIVKPELARKWNGKIVDWDDGWCWSLEGRQYEGVALTCPDEDMRYLTNEETAIAELLDATFWERDRYSEDVDFLRSFLKS